MSAYTQPIYTAILVFALLAFVLFIPWVIYTYRKYHFLSVSKMLVTFSFIFYMLAALFLVLLPLPETTNTCALQRPDTQVYNLRPFQFVSDILYKSGISLSNPATWIYTLKQPSFYQAFFNFLLLMPLGVYLRYFFKERKFWLRAYGVGLLVTLFFEITQVTGIYGIYNCPYRIFDIDDLLLNSGGSLIGFFIAPMFLALFPKHEEVVAYGEKLVALDYVRPVHLVLAVFIDYVIISLIGGFTTENSLPEFLVVSGLMVVVLLVVPLVLRGATPGMKLLKIRLVDETTHQFSKIGIVRRFAAIYMSYLLFYAVRIINQIELNFDSPFYVYQVWLTVGMFMFVLIASLVLTIHVIRVLFSKGKRRLFFDAVGKLVPTRK